MTNIADFVSKNTANVTFSLPNPDLTMDQRLAFEDAFFSLVTCNEADDNLLPVMIYLQDEVPVGWYNLDTNEGYVGPAAG